MPSRADVREAPAGRPVASSLQTGEPRLVVRDLGRMQYDRALASQRECLAEVVGSRNATTGHAATMYLLLVEHDPPVITVSRRPNARKHLIASEGQLLAAGVEVAETDRGGDITYHGPGQLVVYPILDLNALGLRLHSYMRLLEQIVIDVLEQFGIRGERDSSATGVWVRQKKICAMGVRISRWVSMHGLALNVTTNLDHFNLIVPCGLTGRTVTSLERELGEACPGMDTVKKAMVARFDAAVHQAAANLAASAPR